MPRLVVFKSVGGSGPSATATCIVGVRGWPANQDHPAYIPRPGCLLVIGFLPLALAECEGLAVTCARRSALAAVDTLAQYGGVG
jgi:hypothetical protein